MQTGAGGLTRNVKTRDVSLAIEIADHPTAGIVRRRNNRDRLAGDVDAEFQAAGVDIREVFANECLTLVRNIQMDAIQTPFLHLEVNRPGDDIARSEFGTFIMLGHETAAIG